LQWAWVHRGARPGSTKWLGPYGLLAHGRKTGELFFHRRRRLAGKIRLADGRWSAVEWPGSNPVGWRTRLVVAERGGLTGRLVRGGGDQRWGKDVGTPEQGSPTGSERLGGSTRRCDAWGGVEVVREVLEWADRGGSETASTMAQWR
jgi:hypothetical protein